MSLFLNLFLAFGYVFFFMIGKHHLYLKATKHAYLEASFTSTTELMKIIIIDSEILTSEIIEKQ